MSTIIFLYRALQNIEESNNSNQDIIEGLINYLDQNFTRDLSVDDLAEMCKLSTRSLSCHFKGNYR